MARFERIVARGKRQLRSWVAGTTAALLLGTGVHAGQKELAVDMNTARSGVPADVLRLSDFRASYSDGNTSVTLAGNRTGSFQNGDDYADVTQQFREGKWNLGMLVRGSHEGSYRLGLTGSRDVGSRTLRISGATSPGNTQLQVTSEGNRLDADVHYNWPQGLGGSIGFHDTELSYGVWAGVDPNGQRSVAASVNKQGFSLSTYGEDDPGDSGDVAFLRFGLRPHNGQVFVNGRGVIADLTRGAGIPTAGNLGSYLAEAPFGGELAYSRNGDVKYWQAQLGGTVWQTPSGLLIGLGAGARYDAALTPVLEGFTRIPLGRAELDLEVRHARETSVGAGLRYRF